MLKQLFIVSALCLLIFLASVVSSASAALDNSPQIADTKKKEEYGALQIKGPMVITSKTFLADSKAHTALFEGSVVAKNENMTIYSDKMLVYYAEKTGNVTRIFAEGSVRLVKTDLIITSKEADYFAEEDKVIFTGEPRAVEKGNVVTGTKMTYLMKEDRSIVENSRVLLENKNGQKSGDAGK